MRFIPRSEGPGFLRAPIAIALLTSVGALAVPAASQGTPLDRGLVIDYPLDGSIVPPDMLAPRFRWHDDSGAERWRIRIEFEEGEALEAPIEDEGVPERVIDPRCVSKKNDAWRSSPYQASAKTWQPPDALWDVVRQRSLEAPARVTLRGFGTDASGRVFSSASITLKTSKDPVGAPIFYRDVPLIPAEIKPGVIRPLVKSSFPLIKWRLRDVSRTSSRVILTDMPSCANCHSFSASGDTLGMDVDGPSGDKGSYAFVPLEKNVVIEGDDVITWNSFEPKPEGHNTLGFLSRVSPDGRTVVSTVNEELFVVNYKNFEFCQVFYPTRGILAYYSRDTGEFKSVPGADDPDYVHCDPVWTPDGRALIFARARARDAYIEGRKLPPYAGHEDETPIQYDLYRLPFEGGQGGIPEAIVGASNNGMSNTFPKISPDGKWLVFTQCRNGQLMRPDGRLWIVPLEGGQAREMRCNTSLMNSWHSFSPNGRWMVFSSKSRRPFTEMFLTHIDENGVDSPALVIEGCTADNRAVNIPEFVNVAYDDFESISVPAVQYYAHFNRARELVQLGKHEKAVAEFELALQGDPQDSRIHDGLAASLVRLGRIDEARVHTAASVRIDPQDPEARANHAVLLADAGLLDEAREQLDEAVRLAPDHVRYWFVRAGVRAKSGDLKGALADYDEVLRLNPKHAKAYCARGFVRKGSGNLAGARSDFDAAIRLKPIFADPHLGRAAVLRAGGDREAARQELELALANAPPNWPLQVEAQALARRIRDQGGG